MLGKLEMNTTRQSVLGLYRRAMMLAQPYVESEGVKAFMKKEFIRDLSATGNVSRDEILRLERQLNDTDFLVSTCKENIRNLFKENVDIIGESKIAFLVKQGNIELDVIEKKIVGEQAKFGVIKEGANVKYVTIKDE